MSLPAEVLAHFEEPRNVGRFPPLTPGVQRGAAGSAASGDMIEMELLLRQGRIEQARFRAFGCPSAIASASLATTLVSGLAVAEALGLEPDEIVRRLALPEDKRRFAGLALEAVRAALRAGAETG